MSMHGLWMTYSPYIVWLGGLATYSLIWQLPLKEISFFGTIQNSSPWTPLGLAVVLPCCSILVGQKQVPTAHSCKVHRSPH